MPSVDQCRRLLRGAGATLTDEEIEAVRDQIAILADAAIDAFLEGRDG
jgi:hypothetical protein